MQLKKELSALVEKHTWNRVILRIIDTTWNIGHNFRLKDQQKTLMKYGVVYKLTCSCGSSYIGQTRRNLINRLKEHSSSDKSEVCRHLSSCFQFYCMIILSCIIIHDCIFEAKLKGWDANKQKQHWLHTMN